MPAVPAALPAPELERNQLAEAPSPLLRSQAASPVRWQPWSAATMQRAKDARRLVLAVIVRPQQTSHRQMLAGVEADAVMVRAINTNYVPVLVDGEACREMVQLAATLCGETKRTLQLPLFIWFTSEGNPVAWVPAPADHAELQLLFQQSHDVMARMWETSQEYILRNSASDQQGRRARLAGFARPSPPTAKPADDCLAAIRQLGTLYDPVSHTFDSAGGIFPAASLTVLSTAALAPGLGDEFRHRVEETSDSLSRDLSTSAMIDPLDGGIHAARRGPYWNLPMPDRDCVTQARAAIALLQASRAPGNPQLIEQALAALRFAETRYATPDGLFALGLEPPTPQEAWLWKLEDLEAALPTGQARLWAALSDLKSVGNLPIESDPKRDLLRYNSLALQQPLDQVAARLGLSPEDARREFESSRKVLLERRNQRFKADNTDRTPQAAASFQMVSAYAAAYATTGDPAFRQHARELFQRARERFTRGADLTLYAVDGPPADPARAHHYGTALQAALDLADVTLEREPAAWAAQLAARASELFLKDGMLLETPAEQNLTGLPLSNRTIQFDESTASLLAAADIRLTRLGFDTPPELAEATPLGQKALDFPIVHSDLLLAALIRHHGVAVTVAADAPADLKDAVACLPLRIATRRLASPEDRIPAASVRLRFAHGEECNVTTMQQLLAAIQAGGPPP